MQYIISSYFDCVADFSAVNNFIQVFCKNLSAVAVIFRA